MFHRNRSIWVGVTKDTSLASRPRVKYCSISGPCIYTSSQYTRKPSGPTPHGTESIVIKTYGRLALFTGDTIAYLYGIYVFSTIMQVTRSTKHTAYTEPPKMRSVDIRLVIRFSRFFGLPGCRQGSHTLLRSLVGHFGTLSQSHNDPPRKVPVHVGNLSIDLHPPLMRGPSSLHFIKILRTAFAFRFAF